MPLPQSAACGWIVTCLVVVCRLLLSYSKTLSLMHIHAQSDDASRERCMRVAGLAIQLGALAGSLVMLGLVDGGVISAS